MKLVYAATIFAAIFLAPRPAAANTKITIEISASDQVTKIIDPLPAEPISASKPKAAEVYPAQESEDDEVPATDEKRLETRLQERDNVKAVLDQQEDEDDGGVSERSGETEVSEASQRGDDRSGDLRPMGEGHEQTVAPSKKIQAKGVL